MILGYKKQIGNEDAYHFGKVAGVDKRFIRVIAGLMLPRLERQSGAIVVIGELYRSLESPDFTVLDICIDQFANLKTATIKFFLDLKYNRIVVESQASEKMLWNRMKEILNGGVVPFHAPDYALTEVGRQTVTGLINEGHFHYGECKGVYERDPDQGAKATQCAIVWALENPAFYLPSRGRGPQRMGGYLGMQGLD